MPLSYTAVQNYKNHVLALWIILSNICLSCPKWLDTFSSAVPHWSPVFPHSCECIKQWVALHSQWRSYSHVNTGHFFLPYSICVYKSIKKTQPNEKKNPNHNHLILQKPIIYTNMCRSPHSNLTHPNTLYEAGGFVLDTSLKKLRKFTLSWCELPRLYDLCPFTSAFYFYQAFDVTFISILT